MIRPDASGRTWTRPSPLTPLLKKANSLRRTQDCEIKFPGSNCTCAPREPQWRVSLGRTDPPRYSSCVFIVTFGFRGRSSWVRHRGPGGGRHLRRPSRRQGGRRWGRRLVWADGAAACARLARFFFPPTRVEARLTALQCWKTVRERYGGVLSGAVSWQLGRLLHATGRGSALLRRPRFVLLRRTGALLDWVVFAALLRLHSQAVDVAGRKSERLGLSPLLGAPLLSLCALVALGRAAPHCAVVFNSCLNSRLGAEVRIFPVQRLEAEARG